MKTWSSLLRRSDSDYDYDWSDAYSGGPEMGEWLDRYDLDQDESPHGVEVWEHGRLVDRPEDGGLGFHYDGNERYPGYSRSIWRRMSDGSTAQEGHHLERNPNNSPVEDSWYPTGGRDSVDYPWAYTYYPPGASDQDALHKGFNSLQDALTAHSMISVWGDQHPRGKKALEGFEKW